MDGCVCGRRVDLPSFIPNQPPNPNSNPSALVAAPLCVFNDAPWLRGRVDPDRLRVVHPGLSLGVCRRLGIHRVSESERERVGVRERERDQREQCAGGRRSGWSLLLCVARFPSTFDFEFRMPSNAATKYAIRKEILSDF